MLNSFEFKFELNNLCLAYQNSNMTKATRRKLQILQDSFISKYPQEHCTQRNQMKYKNCTIKRWSCVRILMCLT